MSPTSTLPSLSSKEKSGWSFPNVKLLKVDFFEADAMAEAEAEAGNTVTLVRGGRRAGRLLIAPPTHQLRCRRGNRVSLMMCAAKPDNMGCTLDIPWACTSGRRDFTAYYKMTALQPVD